MNTEPTEAHIKRMAERFLCWKLPNEFSPDGGISFDKVAGLGTEHQYYREPTGTNLLTYTQAEAMVRHMTDGLIANQQPAIAPELVARAIASLEAICVMQTIHYGDGMKTHMELSGLCDTARAILAELDASKPDPVQEALRDCDPEDPIYAHALVAALAKRGLHITEIKP